MKIESVLLNALAKALEAERKRQKLSREGAAAVCGVSASFIRDVETNPENCSLGKLVRLINGLGLSLNIAGLHSQSQPKTRARLSQPDFGVPDAQIVRSKGSPRPIAPNAAQPHSEGTPS